MNQFSVTVLGSSSALPTSKRFTSAHVMNIHERFFLIDCGEGTQVQLRRFKVRFGKIDHVFISHVHGDHILGIFGLLSSFNLLGRTKALHIYGPADIKIIIDDHFKYYEHDRKFKIVYHFIEPNEKQVIYEDKSVFIEAISLKHRVDTFGFLFHEKRRPNHMKKEKIEEYSIPVLKIPEIIQGADFITEEGELIKNEELTYPSYTPRTYAYISDTMFDESIVPHIKDFHLLYHESTFLEEHHELAKETYHSTARQAAEVAEKANVRKLLLGHFSTRYKRIERFEEEAAAVFPNIVLAEDGLRIDVPCDDEKSDF